MFDHTTLCINKDCGSPMATPVVPAFVEGSINLCFLLLLSSKQEIKIIFGEVLHQVGHLFYDFFLFSV